LTVISVSLTPELLNRLDEFVEISGYSSRSEALRLAVRDTLSQFALRRLEIRRVIATITVISEREMHGINSRLMDLRHEFDENVFGNMHLHIGGGYCVEIYLVQGDHDIVMKFITKVRAVKGIMEVRYTITPIEENI
jgi:CopG family nickel-responsive transcriptional regulator